MVAWCSRLRQDSIFPHRSAPGPDVRKAGKREGEAERPARDEQDSFAEHEEKGGQAQTHDAKKVR